MIIIKKYSERLKIKRGGMIRVFCTSSNIVFRILPVNLLQSRNSFTGLHRVIMFQACRNHRRRKRRVGGPKTFFFFGGGGNIPAPFASPALPPHTNTRCDSENNLISSLMLRCRSCISKELPNHEPRFIGNKNSSHNY